jgi:hypothetical protein
MSIRQRSSGDMRAGIHCSVKTGDIRLGRGSRRKDIALLAHVMR